MNIAEAGSLQCAAEPVALSEHEETRAGGMWGRGRHRHVFQNNPCRGGEEGLLFLAPGHERRAPTGLQDAETFAECFGQVRKKHNAEAARKDVVGFAGERKRLGAGFSEFNVGKPFFARQLFSERHHARSKIGGGYAPGVTHFLGDRKRGIADAAGEINNTHPRANMRTLKNALGRASAKCTNLVVPLPPPSAPPLPTPSLI